MGELIEHNEPVQDSALSHIPSRLSNRKKLALAAYKVTKKKSQACIAADIVPGTLSSWLADDDDFRQLFQLVDDQLTDMLEEVLIDQAKEGSFPHLQMELKARNRGKYDRPQKVDVDQTVSINVMKFAPELP